MTRSKKIFTKMSIKKKGIAIIASANNNSVHFCLRVIALSLTKSSRCLLYIFVPLNQRSNLSEPFTKQYAARRKKGVVGSIGNIIPTIPNPTHKSPISIYTQLIMVLIFILSPLIKISSVY